MSDQHEPLLTTCERAVLIQAMPPAKRRALMLVVTRTLYKPENRLSDSCRELLESPHDESLRPALEEMLTYFVKSEGQGVS